MINVTLILIANSYDITPIQDGDRVVKESHVMMCPEELAQFTEFQTMSTSASFHFNTFCLSFIIGR